MARKIARKLLLLILIAAASPIVLSLGFAFSVILVIALFNFPFTSTVVAQKKAESGTEVCIVQRFKDLSEPYQVSLYAKHPGGNWRWHYMDHEADRLRYVSITIEGNTASIYEGRKLRSTWAVDEETLTDKEAGYFPGEWNCQKINQEHKSKVHNAE